MAKKSMIAREAKRKVLTETHADKRAKLIQIVKSLDSSGDEQMAAMFALQKLPRDSSKARKRNRCFITGRPRGYYRKFGLARNKLRELIMKGETPGVSKSSW